MLMRMRSLYSDSSQLQLCKFCRWLNDHKKTKDIYTHGRKKNNLSMSYRTVTRKKANILI